MTFLFEEIEREVIYKQTDAKSDLATPDWIQLPFSLSYLVVVSNQELEGQVLYIAYTYVFVHISNSTSQNVSL